MKILARWLRGVPAVLLCASLSGCLPSARSELDEEREPHFVEGKSRIGRMDYKGAIEKFEQTLDGDSHHAKAHFELGCLYEEKEPDAAAAIYHYEQYLKLRPEAENAEFIRQRITNCKQDLAKTALLPITPGMQHQFDQLAEENRRLQLELEQWKAYAARIQSQSTAAIEPSPTPPGTRISPATSDLVPTNVVVASSNPGTRSATVGTRTYTVQSGDSLYGVAKRYGVRLEALTSANPGVDARKLRVGQVLTIPAS